MSTHENVLARVLAAALPTWQQRGDASRSHGPDVGAIAKVVSELFVALPGTACWSHGAHGEYCRIDLGCHGVPIYRMTADVAVIESHHQRGAHLHLHTMARVAHEAIRALQETFGHEPLSPPWAQASVRQQASMLAAVQAALDGASINDLHRARCGPWDDPCFVPYDRLSPEHQATDAIVAAVVSALGDTCISWNA